MPTPLIPDVLVRRTTERAISAPLRSASPAAPPRGFGPVVRELPDHGRACAFVSDGAGPGSSGAGSALVCSPPWPRVTTVPHAASRLGAVDLVTVTLLVALTAENRVEAWDLRTGARLRASPGPGAAELPGDAAILPDATAAPDWAEWVTQDGMCVVPGERGLLLWHIPVVEGECGDGQWVHGVVVDVDPEAGTFGVAAAWRFFEPGCGLECPTLDAGRGLLHAVRTVAVPGSEDDDETTELLTVALVSGTATTTAIPVPKNTDVDRLELDPATGQVTAVVVVTSR